MPNIRSLIPASLLPPVGPVRPAPAERFFTPEALQRAWLAVKRAGGGAGVDDVTLEQFAGRLDEELSRLRGELIAGSYRPRPVRRVLVPKPNGGLRPLALWALRDRVAQRAVYDIIAPAFEAIFLPCSFGYRPGLGVEDAVRQVLAYRDEGRRWVMDGDIQDCFDSIPADRLAGLVGRRVLDPLLRRYIGGWLDAQILNGVDGVPTKAGACQGSVLSPLLANIYLHEVDRLLVAQRLALVRYADNLLICCRRKAEAEEAMAAADQALAAWGLRLNEHKSRIVHFDQGFAWLGYFLLRGECFRL
ncbi:MAG: reverse transcriptase domain-containing protein [Anaerolineae bacterium]